MKAPQVVRELKRDALGRVELLDGPAGLFVRRVAHGTRVSLLSFPVRLVARVLLRRERRALAALAHLADVPRGAELDDYARAPGIDGTPASVPRSPKDVLVRSFLDGVPLYQADALPRDFFERLEDLVRELHSVGVCHNDLHKEPNILVAPDGRPLLIDFQLASIHPTRGRAFCVRSEEDLRHVRKHRAVYERAESPRRLSRTGRRPSLVAALWMRLGKPVYNVVTRRVLKVKGGEPRRPRGGPWPRWTEEIGPR